MQLSRIEFPELQDLRLTLLLFRDWQQQPGMLCFPQAEDFRIAKDLARNA